MEILHVRDVTFRALCLQAFAVSCALSQGGLRSQCGEFHCFDACCLDHFGNESCCYSSLYHEPWFWVLIVIGVIIVVLMLLYVCRALYRYHNAGQYTKLRLQQPHYYGTVPAMHSVHLPPPQYAEGNCPLPSYAAVTSKPPLYSE